MARLTMKTLLVELNEILYPGGDREHQWEVSYLDDIARVLLRYDRAETTQKLAPPDKHRCQADVPGSGPFTVGGEIGDPTNGYRTRCKNRPVYIAKEKKPGPDGLRGVMSLCACCRIAMEEQMPGACEFHRLVTLKLKRKEKKES